MDEKTGDVVHSQAQQKESAGGHVDPCARVAQMPEDDGDQRLDKLRVKIQCTEAKMGRTLDAIEDRLSLDSLVRNAGHKTREFLTQKVQPMLSDAGTTLRGAASDFVETARKDPVPVMLMGAGAGLLVMSLLKGRKDRKASRRLGEGVRQGDGGEDREVFRHPEAMPPPERSSAGTGYGQGSSMAASAIAEEGGMEEGRASGFLTSNALPLTLSALVAGSVLALLMPASDRERGLLKGWTSGLGETVRDLGREVIRSGEDLIHDMQGEARDEAEPGAQQ